MTFWCITEYISVTFRDIINILFTCHINFYIILYTILRYYNVYEKHNRYGKPIQFNRAILINAIEYQRNFNSYAPFHYVSWYVMNDIFLSLHLNMIKERRSMNYDICPLCVRACVYVYASFIYFADSESLHQKSERNFISTNSLLIHCEFMDTHK